MRVAKFIGLFISLIGFWLLTPIYRSLLNSLGVKGLWSVLSYTMAQLTGFLLLLMVLRLEDSSLDSVWFGTRDLTTFLHSMGFLLIGWIVWGFLDWVGSAIGLGLGRLAEMRRGGLSSPIDLIPMAVWGLAASFFEETFYRGYALTRLLEITGNVWISSAISIAFFTLIHLFFGPRVMLCILGWSVVITVLFFRKGTYASFYYHLVNNLLAYVLLPSLSLLH